MWQFRMSAHSCRAGSCQSAGDMRMKFGEVVCEESIAVDEIVNW